MPSGYGLTEDQKRRIREEYAKGKFINQIAGDMDISRDAVKDELRKAEPP